MPDESVLVVPQSAAEDLYRRSFWSGEAAVESVLALVREQGRFVRRAWAESTPVVKQVVAFGVVHSAGRVLVLRHARENPRPALRLRYSMLFGGHVSDAEAGSFTPVQDCLARELREELGIVLPHPATPLGVISDAGSDSGSLHLGVAFQVPHHTVSLRLPERGESASEFEGRATRRVQFADPQALARRVHRFDHWSQILLYEGVIDGFLEYPLKSSLPPLQLQFALP